MNRNNISKKICIILSFLMLLVIFVSCKSSDDSSKTSKDNTEYLDDIPSSLNYNDNQINIIYWSNSFVKNELVADNESSDAVNRAVLERNKSIEERLGVKLNLVEGDVAPEHFMPNLENDILAGECDFDIVAGVQCQSGKLAIDGCYADLANTKYLDLSKSYWNSEYIDQLNLDTRHIYMLGGDISLTTTAWAATMLFNVENYENNFGSIDTLYNCIIDGKWTLDEFYRLCRECYKDIDGDNEKSEGDQYGFSIMKKSSIVDMFFYSSGAKFSKRDSSDYPVLDVANEKSIKFLSTFVDQLNNNDGIYAYLMDDNNSVNVSSLFEATTMDAITQYKDYYDDFGVIPYPKLDENEKSYHSWLSDNTVVYSVPVTVDATELDMISAVLELMCAETRRICLPVYYESALGEKYTMDDWSRQMIDIIHDGVTADFASIYSERLDSIGTIMRQLVGYDISDLSTHYESIKDKLNTKYDELITSYYDNNLADNKKSEQVDDTSVDISNYTAENQLPSSWSLFGTKFRNSGVRLNNDITSFFSYTVNDKGGIVVKSPPSEYKGGFFPTAGVQSNKTISLSNLAVNFNTDSGFVYNNIGYSASFSFVWCDNKIDNVPKYIDQIATNGMREAVPTGCNSHALSVIFMGTSDTNGSTADILYIILNDGSDAAPEIDNRVGYRWYMYVDTDLSKGVDIRVKEDSELGYVVSVNGVEYREAYRGSELIPIDLNSLKDVNDGYLSMVAEVTDPNEYANFTWNTINGKSAATYFEN